MCMCERPGKDGLEFFEFPWKTKITTQMHLRVLFNVGRGTVGENRSSNASNYGCDHGKSNSS